MPLHHDDARLYNLHDEYFRWTEALWTHFFAGKEGRKVRLSLDDDELDEIGKALSISEPRTSFIKSVRKLVDHYDVDLRRTVTAVKRIAKTNDFTPPAYLGLLGACVLVASRMANDPSYTSSAYFPRFNSDLIGSDSKHMIVSFPFLREVWLDLHRELAGKYAGAFGVLGLPHDPTNSPLRNRPNINLPLSQCLFRSADRERLDDLCRDWAESQVTSEQAFMELSRHVERWPERFTAALRTNLELAAKEPDFRAAYVEELADMLEDVSLESGGPSGPKAERNAGLGVARIRMLLRRNSEGATAYDFTLEASSEGSWLEVPDARLESSDIIGRYRAFFQDRECGYAGSNPQVFIDDGDGNVISHRQTRLPSRALLVIVSTAAHEAELLEFARRVASADSGGQKAASVLPLMERLGILRAISFPFSSKAAEGVPLPSCMSRYAFSGGVRIELVGGLKVDGRYLPAALPLVEIDWDGTGDVPKLYCDGDLMERTGATGDLEFRLTDAARSVGLHEISSSDGSQEWFEVREARPRRAAVAEVPSVSIYFGEKFLYTIGSARDFKLARKQSGGSKPTALLMQGARLFTRDSAR